MRGVNLRKARETSVFANACVDTLAGVRYAFEFTQLELLHLRGTDKPPHG